MKSSNFKKKLVIATVKTWNINNAIKFAKLYEKEFEIYLISKKEDLNIDLLNSFKPHYVFLVHWSWLIPKEIYESNNCIAFHIADLPYGRGGSPLQNQIIRKIYNTAITAFKVGEGIDDGEICLKEKFYIGLGCAEEIFIRASDIIFFKMIPKILENGCEVKNQVGETLVFRRRKPEESDITCANINTLEEIYDFIRMLDGEGYPKAYIKINNLRIEFSEVHLKKDRVCGRFEVFYENE